MGNVLVVTMLLFMVVSSGCATAEYLAGCTSTPVKKPETQGVVFQQPTDVVRKVAIDVLVAAGFEIKKSETLYVEGCRTRKFFGGGGETVGIWLESLGSSTLVHVNTAKSLIGILRQKNWDEEIPKEMEKSLGDGSLE